jgi:hypothetical protein
MEMILCDWTRMGHTYCFAGAVLAAGAWTFVRPVLHTRRDSPVRNVGWSPFLFDGHCRWEVFELAGVVTPAREPPHVEDLWVRALRPLHRLASPTERRAVLQAGIRPADQLLFGAPFVSSQATASLAPGTGDRSLATILVERRSLTFTGITRQGRAGPDYRVTLDVPGLGPRCLPVVDNGLLRAAELAGEELPTRLRALEHAVGQMGARLAVRLGLSRPFAAGTGAQPSAGVCWLMADGFFSWEDPQP